jgi:single-strand DNA-binding protein
MPSYNKVILMGNLTANPELRFTKAGKAYTQFGLAVNENYQSSEGEKVDRVNFFNVSCFGKQAETLAQYLTKGSPLLVDGRLSQHRWEDDEGKKKSKINVVMRRFQFLPRSRRTVQDQDAA